MVNSPRVGSLAVMYLQARNLLTGVMHRPCYSVTSYFVVGTLVVGIERKIPAVAWAESSGSETLGSDGYSSNAPSSLDMAPPTPACNEAVCC